jgi:hypothetical protein
VLLIVLPNCPSVSPEGVWTMIALVEESIYFAIAMLPSLLLGFGSTSIIVPAEQSHRTATFAESSTQSSVIVMTLKLDAPAEG